MQGTNDGKTDTGEAAKRRAKKRNEEHKEAGGRKVVGKRTQRSL